MTRRFISAGIAAAAGAAAIGASLLQFGSVAQATDRHDDHHNGKKQRFEVDADWPKKLPNRWLVGQVAGVAVDRHDHIWIIQRPLTLTNDEAGAEPRYPIDPSVPATRTSPRSDCCKAAPSVMVFNRAGHLLRAWGGPADPGFLTSKCTPAMGCQWPTNEHGIFVDHNDFVYIGGNGAENNQVLKFSKDGTFIYQIGRAGAFMGGRSNDKDGSPNGTPLLGQPADTEVDPDTNELYIADGYQNKRVLVVDAATGKYKRHWGAYGQNPVDDTAPAPYDPGVLDKNFRNPVHCVRIANDGLVYVCDRVNNRYQIFTKDGKFVDEVLYARDTLGNGAIWDVDLSPDRRQRNLYNADGENNNVVIFDRRSGEVIGKFGRNGRSAGQFHWVHNLAVDSRGNIYTAEVDTGKRAQKFKPAGRHDHDHD
jgi:DNA-binding beta-propeller fold protein YncE